MNNEYRQQLLEEARNNVLDRFKCLACFFVDEDNYKEAMRVINVLEDGFKEKK